MKHERKLAEKSMNTANTPVAFENPSEPVLNNKQADGEGVTTSEVRDCPLNEDEAMHTSSENAGCEDALGSGEMLETDVEAQDCADTVHGDDILAESLRIALLTPAGDPTLDQLPEAMYIQQ